MTRSLPSLAGAPWFTDPAVRAVFEAVGRDRDDIRIVGGAVRNALMGVAVADIDFATRASPEIVAERAHAAGLKVVPTGIEHGTQTVVADGSGFEITTLREDIETDGRRAVVRFGRDWRVDASRRDFTVNALYVDSTGKVHDPLGGYADLVAGKIRFIGEADRRIAEDRLRVLRFFRFHAQYGKSSLDRDGLLASIRARHDLRQLSAERVGREMRLLVTAKGACDALTIMQDSGILQIVFGGIGYLAAIRRLQAFEVSCEATPEIPLRLAAIGCRVAEDVTRLVERLRLSNAERNRMLAAVAATAVFVGRPGRTEARKSLYRLGQETYQDGVALAFSQGRDEVADAYWCDLYSLPENWAAPTFPLGGRDVLAATGLRGPAVGTILKQIEDWWIENDFGPDESALRNRLQQIGAASQ